ncbi:hypothetical protein LTR62_000781 [Meristemomyces frigidus]|uniref:Uncharacterized protein n=1 Tax=Meristemomyces frigidus TaxID=1508187 RepID=A0AAN7YIG1_9PEZI|nr:hypothetical protein LTR62_000781 [Meristemomyces frigidus]
MPRNLTINPTPYKSSNLALPPSPFSPRLPLTPLPKLSNPTTSTQFPVTACTSALKTSPCPPPPTQPLNWLWQCHLCTSVYQLGTTRRCLSDGHFFCAGTTTVKTSRRSKKRITRHKACASEFDYRGWKDWGVWRREVEGKVVGVGGCEGRKVLVAGKKDCWGRCDYPSECRWGKEYGVATPTATTAVVLPSTTPSVVEEKAAATKPEMNSNPLLLVAAAVTKSSSTGVHTEVPEPAPASESESEPESARRETQLPLSLTIPTKPSNTADRKPSLSDLLASAKRRKRHSAGAVPSPLGSNPPSPTSSAVPSPSRSTSLSPPPLTPSTKKAQKPQQQEQQQEPQAENRAATSAARLQRAYGEFDLDVRRFFF